VRNRTSQTQATYRSHYIKSEKVSDSRWLLGFFRPSGLRYGYQVTLQDQAATGWGATHCCQMCSYTCLANRCFSSSVNGGDGRFRNTWSRLCGNAFVVRFIAMPPVAWQFPPELAAGLGALWATASPCGTLRRRSVDARPATRTRQPSDSSPCIE
jgi:hypothetical protein